MTVEASRRVGTVALAAALVALSGVFAGTWVPVAALIPLVGAVLLGGIEVALPMPKAGTQRFGETGQTLQGDTAVVRARVGRVPLHGNLHVDPVLPDGMAQVPGSARPLRPDGQTLAGGYEVEALRRGRHVPLPTRVARRDGLGLFVRRQVLPDTQAAVRPPKGQRPRGRLLPRGQGHAGHISRQRLTSGDEFYALRDYQPGDAMRSIHWQATARMQRPITAEHLPERPVRVVLYLDGRAFGVEAGGDDVFERTLRAGAELADGLLRAGAHVGLVLMAYASRRYPPAHGRRHSQRLRDTILDAQPLHGGSLLQLAYFGPPAPGADAVLVTADGYDATVREAVQLLRQRHGRCILAAPAFPTPEADGPRELAARAAGALLNAELEAALTHHARGPAVLWRPGDSPRRLFHHLTARRRR